MSKEINLKQAADNLFAATTHTVLYGVASCNEFFTTENAANNACKKNEKPVKFQKSLKAAKAQQTTEQNKTEQQTKSE